MTYEEFSKNVWGYLPNPIAYPEEKEHIEKTVKKMHDQGWHWLEAARFLRLTEEVDGSDEEASLTEDEAFGRMKRISDGVRIRLGRQEIFQEIF